MIFSNKNENIELEKGKIDEIVDIIRRENPEFCNVISDNLDEEATREEIYRYFYKLENQSLQSYNISPAKRHQTYHSLRVLKNIFSKRYETLTHFSALKQLKKCLNKDYSEISLGFIYELLFLFRGLKGANETDYLQLDETAKQLQRVRLDLISQEVKKWIKHYPRGLDDDVIRQRINNKQLIKGKLGISDKEWNNWEWQQQNVIRSLSDLEHFVSLNDEEKEAISLANENDIPFGITPYYLSLLDLNGKNENKGLDHAIRIQAFPQLKCIKQLIDHGKRYSEKPLNNFRQLPPEISITRGYPMIAIFKPIHINTRLCLYSERNWEINYALWKKEVKMDKIDRAIRWFNRHPEVTEVLILGDIIIFDDITIEEILSRLADIPHIERIRVSTRVPVILPMRITDTLIHLLSSYQIIGRREISLMTHFEHSYEITLEAMKEIQKLRKAGIQVYNQSIYTIENARRFEMAALRKDLRLIGVDPYYSFNAKKNILEERVPIARMIQEQNEESRLAPGIDRPDEAVFSIPGVGKNYLKASQEHELIMIMGDGSRVYEFYPSDVFLLNKKPFIYRDVPIYTFLDQLSQRGENLNDYQSIWYYY